MDFSPFEMGTVYAMMRHGQDVQRDEIIAAQAGELDDLRDAAQAKSHTPEPLPDEAPILPSDLDHLQVPGWENFIGQEPLKRTLNVYMTRAMETGTPLPHVLLATGWPGYGKTTVAKLIAKTMGRDIYELVPPFTIETLASVVDEMLHNDVLLIDEIHRMSLGRSRSAEMLLKVLEEGVIPLPDGTRVEMPAITIIGCTTDPDLLPEPVLDRFKIRPSFETYSITDLARIAIRFAYGYGEETGNRCTDELCVAMALACRGTPRLLDEMVLAVDALFHVYGRPPTPEEMLDFLQIEADGLTRHHVAYLTTMYRHFGRRDKFGRTEYICGENAMMGLLRETKPGIIRLERYLQECGLLERSPRGRKLTDMGLLRVQTLVESESA